MKANADFNSLPASAVGEIGRLLASAEMLKRGIFVSRPELDMGVDVVSHCDGLTRLVQIKTRYGTSDMCGDRERFSVRRRRWSGKGLTYRQGEFDAFVFVSLATDRFWVIPADHINLSSHKLTLSPDSQWLDAWGVLMPGWLDA